MYITNCVKSYLLVTICCLVSGRSRLIKGLDPGRTPRWGVTTGNAVKVGHIQVGIVNSGVTFLRRSKYSGNRINLLTPIVGARTPYNFTESLRQCRALPLRVYTTSCVFERSYEVLTNRCLVLGTFALVQHAQRSHNAHRLHLEAIQ